MKVIPAAGETEGAEPSALSEPSTLDVPLHSPALPENGLFTVIRRNTVFFFQSFKERTFTNEEEGGARGITPAGELQIPIKTDDILGRYIFGDNFGASLLNLYFMKSLSDKIFIGVIELIWWTGSIVSMLFLFGVIDFSFEQELLENVLTLIHISAVTPRALCGLLVGNVVIIKRLLHEFETGYMTFYVIVFFISSAFLLRNDIRRMLIILSWFPAYMWIVFFDASLIHAKRFAVFFAAIPGIYYIYMYIYLFIIISIF